MSAVCDTCGLPEELCVCDDVDRTTSIVEIHVEHRSFEKPVTIVDGVEDDMGSLASELKSTLACGGTVKNGHIELQGDHRGRVEEELEGRGYTVE